MGYQRDGIKQTQMAACSVLQEIFEMQFLKHNVDGSLEDSVKILEILSENPNLQFNPYLDENKSKDSHLKW